MAFSPTPRDNSLFFFSRTGPAVNSNPGKKSAYQERQPQLKVETLPTSHRGIRTTEKACPLRCRYQDPSSNYRQPDGVQVSVLDDPAICSGCMQNPLHVADSMPDRAYLACLFPPDVCIV